MLLNKVVLKHISFLIAVIVALSTIGIISCRPTYETHLWRGTSAYGDGNFDKAVVEFTEAIEINPNSAPSYSWRGSAYYQKAQYDLAIDDFTKAININPNKSDSDYHSRGLSYYAKGEYDLAIQDYTKAINLDPNPYYFNDRGLAYHREKKYDMAIKDFTIAIRDLSKDAEPYSNRADAYLATGQISLARSDLLKAIELSDEPTLTESARERLDSLPKTD